MKVNEAFPSNFLKHEDLNGRDVTLTIAGVKMVDLGESTKPVINFVGTQKEMVCNKTNFLLIADLYGDETDEWIGQRITLREEKTQYAGKRVPCLRIKPEVPPAKVGAKPGAPVPTPPKAQPVMPRDRGDAWEDPTPRDDDIPF